MPGNNVFLPQVTRIPVTGSDQYNTLVCVTARDYVRAATIGQVGNLERTSQSIVTPFKLFGLLDQNPPIAPVFDHSTTAWLSSIGPTHHGSWTIAVDSVTGAGFSPYDGSYFVNVDTACIPCTVPAGQCVWFLGVCFWIAIIEITSFVLCYEPPAKSEGHQRPRPNRWEKSSLNAQLINPARPGPGFSGDTLLSRLGGGALPGAFNPSPRRSGNEPGGPPCKCQP